MAPVADALLSIIPREWHLPYYLTKFHPGVTPLSTPSVVVAGIVGYLTVVFGIREVMRGREPLKLTTLFQIHNIYLTTGSAIVLVLILEEILPIWWNNGLFLAICSSQTWTPRLEFYYMINYYMKYLEFIDTMFLAAKKKPLAFLHVFHHAATALLCYTQIDGRTTVQWVPITINLLVHVFMYYYYWATTTGRKIWWKKYLTTMQITQFVIDLVAVYFATYSHFSFKHWPNLPTLGECAGSEGAAIFGCLILTSYLFLFIDFYIRTYKAPASREKKQLNGHAKSS